MGMNEAGVTNGGLPVWIQQQLVSLLAQRGHAWLIQGPSGLGQYDLAMAMARAWLCENPTAQGACGTCGSCHAIDVRTHADLCVLMPETDMLARNWPLSEKAQGEIDDKKRKASKEIRVDAMRDAVEFSQRTSARGRGKAVVVFPAERMNNITANALLKTLEEPPGDVKFVLASEAAHQLLPTIRSRCLGHAMLWPDKAGSLAWMEAQGVPSAQTDVLLRASGGRPDDAVLLAQSGRDARSWGLLPKAVARGDGSGFKDWSPPQVIDVLHKLCHDVLAVKVGASPRFFEAADLPKAGSHAALSRWSKQLADASRTMEHPFNPGLMLEALVSQAQHALNALNSGH
jgi:DNA polymerase III subunit delta'